MYAGNSMGDDAFSCEWCCDALAELSNKYFDQCDDAGDDEEEDDGNNEIDFQDDDDISG
jgi:hypothetical protein